LIFADNRFSILDSTRWEKTMSDGDASLTDDEEMSDEIDGDEASL
jgi:hypothetical protein